MFVSQERVRQLVEAGAVEQSGVLDGRDQPGRGAIPAPARADHQRDERPRQLARVREPLEQRDGLDVTRARSPAAR